MIKLYIYFLKYFFLIMGKIIWNQKIKIFVLKDRKMQQFWFCFQNTSSLIPNIPYKMII